MKYLFILLLGLGFTQTELTTRVYEMTDWIYNGETLNIYSDLDSNIDFLDYTLLKLSELN